jgi:hypothetical protein
MHGGAVAAHWVGRVSLREQASQVLFVYTPASVQCLNYGERHGGIVGPAPGWRNDRFAIFFKVNPLRETFATEPTLCDYHAVVEEALAKGIPHRQPFKGTEHSR